MGNQLKLKDQLGLNDELFAKTGCMFGLEKLVEKEKNPGLYEAVWHILLSVCNTAWEVGCKVSASPVAAEGGDALWALHTPTGECICTSRGITAHVGLLASMVRKFIELGYEDSPGFKQGDIFENNDPHYGGIHMPDMDTAMPIFYKGKLVAWASSVTHVADAGAVLPGSINFMNPDTFSDGMPVSLERIGENDRYYPWYELRIKSRTRAPDWVLGDARGRLAGLITVREKLIETIDKYGLEFFEKASREYIEDSRRYAVARIRNQAVPGRVRKSQFKDLTMKGKNVLMPKQNVDLLSNVPMEMNIDGNANVRLSLAGASGSVPFGQNITPTALSSALLMGYSHVVGFDMFNSGPTYALTVDEPPPGSWCNPFPVDWFASTGMGWSSAIRWLSSLYEVTGRLYYMRGFVEEMSAGAGTTMCAEWNGINQYGQYAVCLTLEQASNGSPARGICDGEPAAWCLYTANADFGNAEVMELYYPFMYLGRNMEPDSGGYGKFRGGMGHTTVWMVKNSPEMHYSAACAGANSKITANHGMYGAYPMPGDRVAYAAGTNVKELIEKRQPLVHGRGDDPDHPTLARNITADVMNNDVVVPTIIPETLHEYDLVINPTSGSQAMGDPIERDPALVKDDLDKGVTRSWVAENVHGVIARKGADGDWEVDQKATQEKRARICEERKRRGVPFSEWWLKERKQVAAGANMDEAVKRMWRSSMKLSPGYAAEIRAFWNLPDDFEF
jgi:N-methylhydantoinase B/oxoprolinase/acetone carboxylase alpha subunit